MDLESDASDCCSSGCRPGWLSHVPRGQSSEPLPRARAFAPRARCCARHPLSLGGGGNAEKGAKTAGTWLLSLLWPRPCLPNRTFKRPPNSPASARPCSPTHTADAPFGGSPWPVMAERAGADPSNLSFPGGALCPQEMANILAQKQLRSIILTVSAAAGLRVREGGRCLGCPSWGCSSRGWFGGWLLGGSSGSQGAGHMMLLEVDEPGFPREWPLWVEGGVSVCRGDGQRGPWTGPGHWALYPRRVGVAERSGPGRERRMLPRASLHAGGRGAVEQTVHASCKRVCQHRPAPATGR